MAALLRWNSVFRAQRPLHVRRWLNRPRHDAHFHDFIEITVIVAGRGRHRTAAGSEALARGDAVVLLPGMWHEYHDGEGFSGYDCCFQPELLQRELAWVHEEGGLGACLRAQTAAEGPRRIALDPAFLDLLAPLLESFRDLPRVAEPLPGSVPVASGRNAILRGVLSLLLGGLAEGLARASAPAPVAGSAAQPSLHALAERGQALLAEDLVREWTLTGLARHLGTSPSYLSRAFRSVVGRAPMAHAAHCRMQHAATLLAQSTLPVATIAAQVGIADASYFARLFRAHHGVQPGAYRRRFQA